MQRQGLQRASRPYCRCAPGCRWQPTALQAGRRWSAGVTTRAIASEPPILSIHAWQLVVPPVAFGGAGDAAVLVGESFTSSYGHACGLRRAVVQVWPLGTNLFTTADRAATTDAHKPEATDSPVWASVEGECKTYGSFIDICCTHTRTLSTRLL